MHLSIFLSCSCPLQNYNVKWRSSGFVSMFLNLDFDIYKIILFILKILDLPTSQAYTTKPEIRSEQLWESLQRTCLWLPCTSCLLKLPNNVTTTTTTYNKNNKDDRENWGVNIILIKLWSCLHNDMCCTLAPKKSMIMFPNVQKNHLLNIFN